MKILIKLDRFFAWVLFATMLLYFISGYGMTKGLIDANLATKLHISWLTYIILIAFTVHTSYAIHLALKRWRIWNAPAKILLFLIISANSDKYLSTLLYCTFFLLSYPQSLFLNTRKAGWFSTI